MADLRKPQPPRAAKFNEKSEIEAEPADLSCYQYRAIITVLTSTCGYEYVNLQP
jgi:hypothetical protein